MDALRRYWRVALAAVLLLVTLVWPMFSGREELAEPAGADIVLVIDRTTSMAARDWNGQQLRAEGVAHDVRAIAEAAPSARFSVVVVDNSARVAMPWSQDTNALVTLGETLGWRAVQHGVGSTIGAGTDVAHTLVEASRAARPAAKRYLIYLGDGEQTASDPRVSAAPLAALLDGALVYGYGTTAGATMLRQQGSTEVVSLDGEPQVSRIDEQSLRQLAEELGGEYEHRTDPGPVKLWPDVVQGQAPPPTYDDPPVSAPWLIGWGALGLIGWQAALTVFATRRFHQQIAPGDTT